MFARPSRVLMVAAVSLGLAGCGGSHSLSSIPSAGNRAPQLNGGAGVVANSTLYVSGQGGVYAYDLDQLKATNGTAPPVNSVNGYYYQAAGPGGVTASIAGIATNLLGDLVVVQNYANPQGDGNSCQLTYIPQRTTTSAANAYGTTCANDFGPVTGLAVGVTTTGEPSGPTGIRFFQDGGYVDVLMHYAPSGNPNVLSCNDDQTPQYEVDRYSTGLSNGSPTINENSCTTLDNGTSGIYRAIGGSTNGNFFADWDNGPNTAGTIERYPNFTGTATNTAALPGNAGPMAVSANTSTGAGYRIVASTVNGQTTIYSFKVSGSTFTFTSALGTFGNPIGAVAVGNDGTIYVGVNQPNGVTKVKVYAPGNTEATNPSYILNNAVRRANPANPPAAQITGLAIAQP